ncbi:hypothetical protein CFP56_012666 [Quercus suber]|uniref:Uncharacterized protein n=1 Tax=Quercus suber TaxID=58331 RepID=A0AAW0KW32_QUESU
MGFFDLNIAYLESSPSDKTPVKTTCIKNAFDDACDKSEIDIIAIDFSERLPFRLKQTKVKAAIEVCFLCIQMLSRMSKQGRQMITNAKVRIAKY